METTSNKRYIITCGRTPFSSSRLSKDLMSFVVVGVDEVKAHAHEFIFVIPDELDDYKSDIDGWDGSTTLEFSHADDDIFVFIAAPLKEGTPARFSEFVEEFRHPDSDDETDSDDGSDDDESDDELGANLAFLSL